MPSGELNPELVAALQRAGLAGEFGTLLDDVTAALQGFREALVEAGKGSSTDPRPDVCSAADIARAVSAGKNLKARLEGLVNVIERAGGGFGKDSPERILFTKYLADASKGMSGFLVEPLTAKPMEN